MSPDPDLTNAISALRAGDRARAERLLRAIVDQQPGNAAAWLWLSASVESAAEKRACLQKVLEIDPNHPTAQQALAQLEQPAPTVAEILAARPAYLPLPFRLGRLYYVILFLLIGLALLVAGTLAALVFGSCGSGGASRGQTYPVEYLVEGSAERVLITYSDGAGNYSQVDTTLPWRLTLTMQGGDLPTLTAQSSTESGDLACQILLDGMPWQSASSNAAYGSVTCSGMVGEE